MLWRGERQSEGEKEGRWKVCGQRTATGQISRRNGASVATSQRRSEAATTVPPAVSCSPTVLASPIRACAAFTVYDPPVSSGVTATTALSPETSKIQGISIIGVKGGEQEGVRRGGGKGGGKGTWSLLRVKSPDPRMTFRRV